MRAAVLREYGPPSNLQIEEVEPRPLLPGDVRVRVRAASINRVDWKARSGTNRAAMGWKLPWVQGLDLAGEVVEVGPGVRELAVGDRVWGSPSHKRWGSYAEQCVVAEAELAPMPESLSFVEAASLPLVGQTACQCLFPFLDQPFDRPPRVLIQAGSGGVGTVAIQLAKASGAWVATTCSTRNHELVTELGADHCVDYREQRWWEVLDDLDLVLDAVGPPELSHGLGVVRRGGRISSITTGLPKNAKRYGAWGGLVATGLGVARFWLGGRLRGIDAATVIRKPSRADLDRMARMVADGTLKPVIDEVFPLERIAEAHAYGETGRIRGKVVLEIG